MGKRTLLPCLTRAGKAGPATQNTVVMAGMSRLMGGRAAASALRPTFGLLDFFLSEWRASGSLWQGFGLGCPGMNGSRWGQHHDRDGCGFIRRDSGIAGCIFRIRRSHRNARRPVAAMDTCAVRPPCRMSRQAFQRRPNRSVPGRLASSRLKAPDGA